MTCATVPPVWAAAHIDGHSTGGKHHTTAGTQIRQLTNDNSDPEGKGTGECSWDTVVTALKVARQERLATDGTIFLPQLQCGRPTTTFIIQGSKGNQYFLRRPVWEWLETRLWFTVQTRRAKRALATRHRELEGAIAWFHSVAIDQALAPDMCAQAELAALTLGDVHTAYTEYTTNALDATARRLLSATDGVTHRPIMHWWSLAKWLQDYTVLGVGSALTRRPDAVCMDNYRTATEVGTSKEYERLWRLGYWRDAPASVRAPLGARLKPNGKWRTVYDGTAGGLNTHIYRSAFPLPSFDDFAANFFPACYLCKCDFSDWFYHIPAAEYTQELLGITDPHTGQDGRYCVYAMGLAESPHYANMYGDEVLRQVHKEPPFQGRRVYNPTHGTLAGQVTAEEGLTLPTSFRVAPDGGLAAEVQLYCDDAVMRGRSWHQAALATTTYASVTRDAGIVMSYPKSEGPDQRLSVLGLGVDVKQPSAGYTVFIPAKKRAELLKMLRDHHQGAYKRGYDTRRNLCAIVSKLYWVVPACPNAADQCRELWDVCYSGVDINSSHMDYEARIKLTGGWKAAARWWERLLADTRFTGETRRGAGRHGTIYGWSDASGSTGKVGGWGATVHMRDADGTEHQGQAEDVFRGKDAPGHSTYKEMRGVEEQLKLLDSTPEWRQRARGATIMCHTDCQPVACAAAKRRAHAKALRPIIRRIRALCARLDVEMEVSWCKGTRLIAQGCDSASRDTKVGVFADDAPDADTFLPSACIASQWTPELSAFVQEWSGQDTVSFDPAAWDDVDMLRRGTILAPRATDTRRCLVTALDVVRTREFEVGLTVAAIDSVPCPFRGLKKYFNKQLLIQPGQHGLSADEAVGIWLLQLAPKERPILGGMPRESVEARTYRRWEGGIAINDFDLLDDLTADANALAHAAVTHTTQHSAHDTHVNAGDLPGVRSTRGGATCLPLP